MSTFKNTTILEDGSFQISDTVLKTIASIVGSEIGGVDSLSGGLVVDFAERLGVRSVDKGVKIEEDNGELILTLNMLVKYGSVIPEICQKTQEAVKAAIENSTDLSVAKVNVNVVGVIMPQGAETE